jgi:uncharacterized protein YqeY
MSLEKTINEQLKVAMLAKDEVGLRSLRAIKAAILIAKTSEGASEIISAEDEMKLLQKLVKQRRDSLEIFTTQNRPDLAQKEREEIAVIEKFLPGQLSADALRDAVAQIIQEIGASSPADMGRTMGVATKKLSGIADGKAISEVVKSMLVK